MKYAYRLALAPMLLLWAWCFDPRLIGSFLRDGRERVFFLTVAIVAGLKISKNWCVGLGLLYAWVVGVWIYRITPNQGTKGVLLFTGIVFLIPELVQRFPRRWFENIIIGSCLLNTFGAFLNVAHIYPFFESQKHYLLSFPVVSFLGHHTILSVFLVFGLCLTVQRLIARKLTYETWEPFILFGYALSTVLIFIAILFTKSSMGYLSLGAAASVFVLFYLGFKPFLAMGLLAIPGLFLLDGNDNGRFDLWPIALDVLRGETMTLGGREIQWQGRLTQGMGIGTWQVIGQMIASLKSQNVWRTLHNEPLQALFEFGALGFALIVNITGVLLLRIRNIYLNRDKEMTPYVAGLIAFSVNALGNFTFHVSPNVQLSAYCMFLVLLKGKKKS